VYTVSIESWNQLVTEFLNVFLPPKGVFDFFSIVTVRTVLYVQYDNIPYFLLVLNKYYALPRI
jgi:hypothetical protein